MAKPRLTEVFGASAAQTLSDITISKADLASVGLTVAEDNSAESLLIAILLLAQRRLTVETYNEDTDQNLYIQQGTPSLTPRGDSLANYRVERFTLNAASLDSVTGVDPDNF